MGIVKSDGETTKSNVNSVKSNVEMIKSDVKTVKGDVDSIKEELESVRETTEQDMETIKSNLTGLYIKLETVKQAYSGYTCGGTSGWKRVAYLNMADTSHNCPTGWRETGYSKRTCGRASNGRPTCDSAIFPVGGMEYTRVCGRVLAYQFGAVSAFLWSSGNIESHYVNGLSLSHGSPGSREHIWTFAVGLAENATHYSHRREQCPCDGGTSPVPEFVGNNYFCESGINGPWGRHIFYPNDQLWDGMDCLPTSCCCTFSRPPYFVKEIGRSTTDDIDGRICGVYIRQSSDVAIELVELYVQ